MTHCSAKKKLHRNSVRWTSARGEIQCTEFSVSELNVSEPQCTVLCIGHQELFANQEGTCLDLTDIHDYHHHHRQHDHQDHHDQNHHHDLHPPPRQDIFIIIDHIAQRAKLLRKRTFEKEADIFHQLRLWSWTANCSAIWVFSTCTSCTSSILDANAELNPRFRGSIAVSLMLPLLLHWALTADWQEWKGPWLDWLHMQFGNAFLRSL